MQHFITKCCIFSFVSVDKKGAFNINNPVFQLLAGKNIYPCQKIKARNISQNRWNIPFNRCIIHMKKS